MADRYQSMKYRRCGRSGLLLPAISLGAWETFGGYRDEAVARECIHRAFDLGITHFDFANNYGKPPGNAELVCGRALRELPRDELIIATKAGFPMWSGPYGDGGSRKYLIASCDQSLKRLGVDYVDIFYHHRPDPQTPIEETVGALASLVAQGKALYVGVSSYTGEQFVAATEAARQLGVPITIHQPYYNLLGRRVEKNLLPHTTQHGSGVIAFCPLASGLLTDKYLDGVDSTGRPRRTVAGRVGARALAGTTQRDPDRPQSNRGIARADARADGAGVDPAQRRDDERRGRRLARRTDRGERQGDRAARVHRRGTRRDRSIDVGATEGRVS